MNPKALAERRAYNDAIRARIRLIAEERGLPAAEVKKALGLRTYRLVSFAGQFGISLDWLILGDLKGLLRTVRRCA